MTTKERLIQEIEQTPDILLDNLLDFLLFVRNQHENDDISLEEQEDIIASNTAYASGDYLTLDEYLASQI